MKKKSVNIKIRQLEIFSMITVSKLVTQLVEERLYRIDCSIEKVLEKLRTEFCLLNESLIQNEIKKKVPLSYLQSYAVAAKVFKKANKELKKVKKDILKEIGDAFEEKDERRD